MTNRSLEKAKQFLCWLWLHRKYDSGNSIDICRWCGRSWLKIKW